MYKDRYVKGTYNRACDHSGFKFKRSELVVEPLTKLIVFHRWADKIHPSELSYPVPNEKPHKIDARPITQETETNRLLINDDNNDVLVTETGDNLVWM